MVAQEQRNIFFSGSVQGVGFRYTACRIASGYDLTGYVRNLPDGRVECLVEGPTAEIEAFRDELHRAMQNYIASRTEQTAPFTGRLGPFTVRF